MAARRRHQLRQAASHPQRHPLPQLILSSSTSKCRVAFGGITPPAPRLHVGRERGSESHQYKMLVHKHKLTTITTPFCRPNRHANSRAVGVVGRADEGGALANLHAHHACRNIAEREGTMKAGLEQREVTVARPPVFMPTKAWGAPTTEEERGGLSCSRVGIQASIMTAAAAVASAGCAEWQAMARLLHGRHSWRRSSSAQQQQQQLGATATAGAPSSQPLMTWPMPMLKTNGCRREQRGRQARGEGRRAMQSALDCSQRLARHPGPRHMPRHACQAGPHPMPPQRGTWPRSRLESNLRPSGKVCRQ